MNPGLMIPQVFFGGESIDLRTTPDITLEGISSAGKIFCHLKSV